MIKKIIWFSFLTIVSAIVWFINFKYPQLPLQKVFYSLLALTTTYFLFKLIFQELVIKKIKNLKTKYSFRKLVSFLFLMVFILALIHIWVKQPQALLVAYGLTAAGIAVSLQDLFKNLAGGLVLFINKPYTIGDRIQIASKYGDVIDIGILYTTLMELKEWVAGDQATGRLTFVPNGTVLSSHLDNYTKDHSFIWDEITVPLTYKSDWETACINLSQLIKKEVYKDTRKAEKEIFKLEEKYYLTKKAAEPTVFVDFNDNWINLHVRYIADVKDRRTVHNKLSRIILSEIKKSKNIKIASQTLDIVGFPK